MDDLSKLNRLFEESMERSEIHSRNMKAKIRKFDALSDELDGLVHKLAEMCAERGLKA